MNALLPDALVMFAIIVAWLNDTLAGESGRRFTFLIAVVSSIAAGVWFAVQAFDPHQYYFFSRMIVVDSFASVMKSVVSFGYGVSLIYSRRYLADRGLFRGDVFLLGMFSLLGQLVMISGNNFLTLYLGLELMSLSLYALIALRRDGAQSSEAAMKYYVLGALASGFVLYGISMLYGASGSLELHDVLNAIASGRINDAVLLFGVIFVVAGVAFKLGAVPFHMWVPDVYQGAPTAMSLFTGGGPKVAAFAWGLRFLVMGLLPLAADWQQMLVILAALSLIVGNITGIVQRNVKRMLAYSAISNMGFVLLGLLSGVVKGAPTFAATAYSSAMFYSIVYLITTLGAFGIVMLLARRDFEAETLDDFKGLNKRSPVFAFVMMVMMFSLAGIPPTVGFYAKLAVLEATINAGLTWLAILGVISSLFGAFYYLRIVKLMYFDAPQDSNPIMSDSLNRGVLLLNGAAVVVLGVAPSRLIEICLQAITHTLPL
ncbi:NADH-quinone oxidoreductase subunit NuoN [Burkholderia glumae]|uniref:NADH-quinone oxidoreductase subunit N n=1 Tax=Burkholderia glumae TaxID=337 RepID=A0AAQ0BUW5_BURGL|nr:NADH-quinone oxidoreductase subunit NuoN [Burkholderia glumae]ACR29657.1 NADH dehydrogenase subunit N [Burkholderia glumae BGR1]AJY66890.1 proton-translocating NADH-quinone oxidoreductase, chain N family protein [Burkholderia glumae LMG 2196 = ATCC 33617]KHJ63441.1 NADH:ubiquinone oxidoreductase subunit N [Burkholderia glumae]MCM2482674.1 NADH-quinone oxidoreductase subunit NuoN [Burkholderia glumae]MCM2490678.1 NADH-quinone oxidoreductase subunit NuoN [Burkholderia glumae]